MVIYHSKLGQVGHAWTMTPMHVMTESYLVDYPIRRLFTTKVLHQQIFSIQTSTGVTTETYQYSSDNPIQGVGQGIGWTGPKWINIMNDKCPGMKFTYPFNTICVIKVADFLRII